MTELIQPPSLSERHIDGFISHLITKGLVALIVTAIVSVVQMFRFGVGQHYSLLLAGSLLSMVVLFAYSNRIVRERGEPRRSFARSITILGGFVPYVLGCYLVFYEGFWRLRLLLDSFSVAVVAVALLWIVAGYVVVSAIYKVSEFGRAVDDGRLKLE